ncbi:undecaprenyl diphosphate synthase [Methylomarinovum caldicuralii]|uniref:Ditrans,polycis-undecaprenyl-diphosphate synthase ((2E,6E)-farnesyl-diphosphate specific) n=1 Tax=Methylomarinovum caldicuralii TaxID=438856 RepID=A0AAU9C8Z8_9GAMM|nr:polyprenyl diphosphate synthase [Methylomarinovum caldicuralii]BCX80944.1 undecaprenyl diphosphate synthase [Methylomarinovum caldicuralii]
MTQALPEESTLPRHVAIIMDGNGRWARRRHLPRTAGHQAGVTAVRKTVEHCARRGIEVLTLFAFSSENWRRPAEEVSVLMRLFEMALARESRKLGENGIRLRVIGDRSAFSPALQAKIAEAEALTAGNDRMTLLIAANYGGRWDIAQAVRRLAREVAEGRLSPDDIDENRLAAHLSFADLPEPDLFIRTGGELRISNFLLWQLAYTELYFTGVLWPDFDEAELDKALAEYARRERRFGHTSEQVARRLSASSA